MIDKYALEVARKKIENTVSEDDFICRDWGIPNTKKFDGEKFGGFLCIITIPIALVLLLATVGDIFNPSSSTYDSEHLNNTTTYEDSKYEYSMGKLRLKSDYNYGIFSGKPNNMSEKRWEDLKYQIELMDPTSTESERRAAAQIMYREMNK